MRGLPDGILLLDGATGTELGQRGIDISPPLWSARALIEAPEVLETIHREYLEAGAGAITTCTFRTHERSLTKAGLGDEAGVMTRRAVQIAARARDAVNPGALILGSVAPLEDCYQPDLSPTSEVCAAEHRAMIGQLLQGGVDLLLIETIGTLREALAAAGEAQSLAPGKWIMSFLTKSVGPPGVLVSGESLVDALPALSGAAAVGVKCIGASCAEDQIKLLRSLLPDKRLCVYANTGWRDDAGQWTDTDAAEPQRYAEYAARWAGAGATIIGGCCGTTPETIRAVSLALDRV